MGTLCRKQKKKYVNVLSFNLANLANLAKPFGGAGHLGDQVFHAPGGET